MCAPDEGSRDRKADFEKNTRENHLACLTYMASIDLVYQPEKNHDRITPNSFAWLQATRDNFKRLDDVDLDPAADIITLIVDTVTDRRHLHFVKPGSTEDNTANFKKVLLLHTSPSNLFWHCTACTATLIATR